MLLYFMLCTDNLWNKWHSLQFCFCHISSAVGAHKCHYVSENAFLKYFVFVLHLCVESLLFSGWLCFFALVLKVCKSRPSTFLRNHLLSGPFIKFTRTETNFLWVGYISVGIMGRIYRRAVVFTKVLGILKNVQRKIMLKCTKN